MLKRFIVCVFAVAAVLGGAGSVARGQAMNVGFEDIGQLVGWDFLNKSNPLGATNWFQGNSSVFPAQAGAADSYVAANYCNTGNSFNCLTGFGTISNWMILPTRTLSNGDTLSFWTKSAAIQFPDRMQVRMSLNGSSSNVGSSETSVGDFSRLLLDINPTYTSNGYPQNWQQYNITLSGIPSPTSGRLAFRYFVEGGGVNGSLSTYIGVDTLAYNPIPEPASLAMLLAGSVALLRRRR